MGLVAANGVLKSIDGLPLGEFILYISRMGNSTDVTGFGHHSARPPRARRHRLLRFLHLPEPPLQARPRRAQGLHLQVPRQGPLNCQSLLFGVSGLIAFSRRRRGRVKKNTNHECLYLHSSGVVAARRWGRTGAAATAFDNKTKTLQTNIYQFTSRDDVVRSSSGGPVTRDS